MGMFYRALLLFLIATVCSLVPTEANYNVYTAQNGMDCIVCSKGYFWIKDCIKNMTIAICQPCPSGTYNNKSGIPHYCSPCTECRDSNSYIKESCTTVTDINCECRYGYYKEFKVKGDKETWYCKPHSSCPPGRGVAKNGTPHEDTICKPCSSGTYSNFSSSLDPCTQCSKCNGSIESVIHECSGTSDTVCRINDEGQNDSGSFVVQHILKIVLPVILLLVVVSCVIGLFYYDYRNDKWCFKKEKDDQVHKDPIVSFVLPASMSPNEAQNQNYINLATENYPESCRYALETDGHDTRFNQEEAAEQPTWDRFFNELCSKIIPDWETIVRDLYGVFQGIPKMADDTGKDEVTKDVLAPAVESGPREDLILTAIKFLQNPKVRQSPLSQRKLFLEKKGLTKAEIDAAVERSGIKEDDASRVYQSPVPLQPGAVPLQPGAVPLQPGAVPQTLPLPQMPVVPYTKWDKTRDVLHTIALIGGLTYAAYKFFKEFLSPYILGKPSHGDRLDRVEKTVNDLQSNVVETLAKISQTLGALQEMITQHQLKMESLSQQVYTKQGLGDQLHPRSNRSDESLLRSQDHQLATEIKSELTSIKGLLLNRRQFPPTPSTKSLPAWQLDNTNTSASSSTTPTRSLVLPPSGDADNISKEAILNSNESGRDSQEDETMQTDVQFSTRSLVDQEGKENTSQQTFTGDKNMDISSEKNVKFENQEVKRENVPNGITEESTYSDNELD